MQEPDTVTLLEDLPECGLKQGDRAAMIAAFDIPEEAYMPEVVDEAGGDSRLADWVKPGQIALLTFCLWLFCAGTGWAQAKFKTVTCTVNSVYDGDNIGCQIKVGRTFGRRNLRIVGIDAPEIRGHQPYAIESRDALRTLVLGKHVTIELRGYDSIWRRHTVRVFLDDASGKRLDVGLQQAASGWAWNYPQYGRTLTANEKADYAQAQGNAKLRKLGLWVSEKPISPSEWRKGKR